MTQVVTLTGGSPWGFRLVGGCDFHAKLAISKVTPGGKADSAGLKPGDVIAAINDHDASQLSHLDAQNHVKSAKSNLVLKVEKGQRTGPTASDFVSSSSFTSTHTAPAKTYQSVRPMATSNAKSSDPLPPPPQTSAYQNQSKNLSDDFPPPPTMQAVTSHEALISDELVCEGCKRPIKGPYLVAQGKNWHPEEFVCASANCGRSLQNCGFIEMNGDRYCSDCYEKYFAQACAKCHKKIVGEVMHALNQTWHVTCFVCTACNQPFKDGSFQMEKDKPYCIEDFNRLFSAKCKGCSRPIQAGEHYVEAINAQWHEDCFTCAVCHCSLKDVGFFAVNNKPVCNIHRTSKVPA